MNNKPLSHHLALLWKHRVLGWLWFKANIQMRYSQTFLGILWIIVLPLAQAAIMAFVFGNILQVRTISGVSFVSFFLTGLVFWNLFQQGALSATHSLTAEMETLTRVYFPREILVLVKLGETLFDSFFVFVAMLIINAGLGIYPGSAWGYFPIVLTIEVILLAGVMLILSYASVYIRDIPQLLNVTLQLLFYLSPILYPLDRIPPQWAWIVKINPLAPLLEAYHRILLMNQPPQWGTLAYPLVLGVGLLVYGYWRFKAHERFLADFI